MTFQMVDGIELFVGRFRDCLRGHQPNNQTTNQSRSGGGCDRIHLIQRQIGAEKRFADQTVQRINMRPGRDLWHHPAVG